MSNPSFSNIDLWLFELAEGNLSPEQAEQLGLFLLNHPELDVDRDVWEMARVDKQAIAYPDMASLERKRRPVAYFAFTSILLLLIGSGSYLTWNVVSGDGNTVDLAAQNESVKRELFDQIRSMKELSTSEKVLEAGASILPVGRLNESNQQNSNTNARNSAQFVSNNAAHNRQSSVNSTAHQRGTTSELGILNTTIAQNQYSDGTLIDPANVMLQTNVTAFNIPALPEEIVGNEAFYVRKPKELEIYEGRNWNPNRSPSTSGQTFASQNNSKSIKDHLSKFARNLERMMNAPIALKNARDPHYHVPGLTANDINFSSAGTLVSTRVQATSRLQWQGKENEQLMNQLSADGYSYGIRGGWGVQLNHQWYKDGGIQVAQAAITYSPKISVNNWFSIEPSFRLKMGNKQLDLDHLGNTDQVELDRGNAREFYPNGATPIGQSLWYKDAGVGLLVNTKWFFAGVQVDNLFKHKDNLYDNNWSDPRRAQNYFTASIGSDWISRSEKLSLSPYLVYQKNERLSEAWLGANFACNWFNIGLAASSNFEPAASIGIKFDQFSLHYNADYTDSKILGGKALSHQLTMRFVGKQNKFGKQLFKR